MPDEGPGNDGSGRRLMSPKAAISVANNVIGAILGTMALIFIAQNMGPAPLGILAYAMAFVGMLSFLSDFGVGSVHAQQVNERSDVGKCVGAYAVIKISLLAIFSLVTLVLIQLWERGLINGEMTELHSEVDALHVFLIYYVLLGISQIATHTFDALGAVAKAQVPSMLEIIVRVSFIVYIAATPLAETPQGPALLAAAYGAGIVASSLLVALLISQLRISRPDREILLTYIRSLTPVFIVSMILVVDLYLDKVVVGYFCGEYEVGLYFGVQKMAVFVGVFSLSVATLILPSVTTYFARRDVASSWEVVNQAERYVSLVVIPTATFYLAYGSQILTVFLGGDFTSSVDTMNVLVLSSALVAIVLPLRSAIAGAGSMRTLFYVGVGGLVLQLSLMLVLVPSEILGFEAVGLKGLGAAYALLATSVYFFFTLRYMAWKSARIIPNSRSFKHLLAAVVMVGAMYVTDWALISEIGWLSLIFLAFVGMIAYAITVYLMGELEMSDYRYFRAMLNPQDAARYVLHELLGKRLP